MGIQSGAIFVDNSLAPNLMGKCILMALTLSGLGSLFLLPGFAWFGVMLIVSMFSIVELWHLNNFGSFSSFQSMYSIVNADLPMSLEFAKLNANYLFCLGGLILSSIFLTLQYRKIPNRFRVGVGTISLLLFLAISGLLVARDMSITGKDPQLGAVSRQIEKVFPWGSVVRVYQSERFESRMSLLGKQYKSLSFGTVPLNKVTAFDNIVLVIGESSRIDHWQIFGYGRQTSPRLAGRDLIKISNAYSPGFITSFIIPRLVTEMSVNDRDDSLYVGAIPLFKEYQYHTSWISNQPMEASPILEAQRSLADYGVNLAQTSRDGHYDGQLIPILDSILDNGAPRHFSIINLLGQHFNYSHRYPEAFGQYRPEFSKTAVLLNGANGYQEQIRNSYDNAVLYNDFVLDSVISVVQKYSKNALVVFVADHGELLFDSNTTTYGHAYPFCLKQQLNVPVFFWTQNPQAKKLLAEIPHKGMLSTDALLETIEWLTGVKHTTVEIEQTWFGKSGDRNHISYLDGNSSVLDFPTSN
jgi:glucan phosphoethanolaminetransferase (alkaline phosphatase superfamily)